jgi:hypothetical protein
MKFIQLLLKGRRNNAIFRDFLANDEGSAFRCGDYKSSAHDKGRNDKKVDKRHLFVPSFRIPGHAKAGKDNT